MAAKARIIIIALIFLSLSVNGCSRSLDGNNPSKSQDNNHTSQPLVGSGNNGIVIGLALGTRVEERWVKEKEYFQKEAEKSGAKVIIRDANMDEEAQNSQIQELIRDKVDVLVVVPVNAKTSSSFVLSAKQAGIPVLAYSRMIENADIDAFIGFDSISIGEKLATSAIEKVPQGNYLIINGATTDNNSKLQQVGYYNILKKYIQNEKIKVVDENWCENWSAEKAYTITLSALKKNKNSIQAIIVSNDGMASGVVQALKEQKIDGKVFVTGTDGELSALQRIANGTQSVTLLFPQKEFAEEAARVAICLANKMVPADATGTKNNGLKEVPTIFAKTVLVTKENLNDVVIKSELYTNQDIFKNSP